MNEQSQPEQHTTRMQADQDIQRIHSESLFGAQREIVIVHNGREYRLRLTQNDKMILTA